MPVRVGPSGLPTITCVICGGRAARGAAGGRVGSATPAARYRGTLPVLSGPSGPRHTCVSVGEGSTRGCWRPRKGRPHRQPARGALPVRVGPAGRATRAYLWGRGAAGLLAAAWGAGHTGSPPAGPCLCEWAQRAAPHVRICGGGEHAGLLAAAWGAGHTGSPPAGPACASGPSGPRHTCVSVGEGSTRGCWRPRGPATPAARPRGPACASGPSGPRHTCAGGASAISVATLGRILARCPNPRGCSRPRAALLAPQALAAQPHTHRLQVTIGAVLLAPPLTRV
ncbi:hypothetical protein ACJJTC_015196 [Scirpophaga incertulas]